MKKFVMKPVFTLLLATIAVVVGVQRCNGTRSRTSDFTISTEQVLAQIKQLQADQASSATPSAPQTSALATFFTLAQDPNASLYYAEGQGHSMTDAGSTMGPIDIVAPMDYRYLTTDNSGKSPSKIYDYLVIRQESDGPHGVLIITGLDGQTTAAQIGGSSSSGTETSGTSGNTGASGNTEASGNSVSVNYAFISSNDGKVGNPIANLQQRLEGGDISTDGFVMDLNLRNKTLLRIRSEDVTPEGDDLTDVIQIRLYLVDSNNHEGYIGQINMIQPQ